MPGLVRDWFIAFFKLVLKYRGVVRLNRVARWLREKSKQLRKVQTLLTDAERCQFIAVTIPEAMAVLETDRLLRRLRKLAVPCGWMVVNMVMTKPGCSFCATVRDEQRPHLEKLDALTSKLVRVPLFPQEVRGAPALSSIAQAIYGDNDG